MNTVHTMQGRFASTAELSHAISQIGWSADFRQLDCGSGAAAFTVIASTGALAQRVMLDRKTQQYVSPRKDFINFGILSGPRSFTKVGRHPLTPTGLLCLHEGGFEAIADPDFCAYTLSFKKARFLELAQNLGIPEPDYSEASQGLKILPDLQSLVAIRAKLDQLCSFVTDAEPSPEQMLEMQALLESEIPASLLLASADAKALDNISLRNRERALRRALDYIGAHPQEALTVEAVCVASASSISTLERAFRERFSISPKRYILVQRLNHVHKALLYQAGSRKIAEIANNWGFWHMGKFAGDYKRLFGYLPSETPMRCAA